MRWISAPERAGFKAMDWNPPSLRRQLPAQHVDVVGEGIGEDVTGAEALRPQSVDQAVGPPGQLRKRECDPGWTADDGRLIWILFGQPPESEPPVPRVLHRE